jgi:hypothetical protein
MVRSPAFQAGRCRFESGWRYSVKGSLVAERPALIRLAEVRPLPLQPKKKTKGRGATVAQETFNLMVAGSNPVAPIRWEEGNIKSPSTETRQKRGRYF